MRKLTYIPKDMIAFLPTEQLVTKVELEEKLLDVKSSRLMWIVVAVSSWAFTIALSCLTR